jgi:hypothetical protein
MKQSIIFILVLYTNLLFSQENEIYCTIFNNSKNFKYLNFYDRTTKDNLKVYNVLNTNFQINGRSFKFNKDTNYTKALADSVEVSKTIYSREVYSHYIRKISNVLSIQEQDYLYNQTLVESINKAVDFTCFKVSMTDKASLVNGFYFQVSNILYFNEKSKAFVIVMVYSRDEEFGDFLFGHSCFIFSCQQGKWEQSFEYESIFL